MIMAEQPVVVFCSFPYLLQEVREPVRLIVAAPREGDAGGSAVGDDVVHLPADRVEVSPCLGVFFIGGKLLRPPRNVVDAVSRSWFALEHREPSLKIRGIRLQNSILDVMTFCTAHSEEAVSFQLVNLTSHQVQHMRANAMYLAAVPLRHGVTLQRVIVFMVAADKGKREGQAFQPVQRFIVATVTKPHTPEVSGADHNVLPCHSRLFGKVFWFESLKISVEVAGHKYHFSISYLNLICSGGSQCRSLASR